MCAFAVCKVVGSAFRMYCLINYACLQVQNDEVGCYTEEEEEEEGVWILLAISLVFLDCSIYFSRVVDSCLHL